MPRSNPVSCCVDCLIPPGPDPLNEYLLSKRRSARIALGEQPNFGLMP